VSYLCRAHDGCFTHYRRFRVRPGGVIPVIQRFDPGAVRGASNVYRLRPIATGESQWNPRRVQSGS
jgi:hypothetical protein